jgi:hypothetical protein
VEGVATDASGNSASCQFNVRVGGPRDVLRQVLVEVQALQAECDDASTSSFLWRSALQLQGTLDPALWMDETHLRWREGDLVFHGVKNAAGWLRLSGLHGGGCVSDAALADFSERLVKSLRLLAGRAIHDAERACVRANQLNEQFKQLEKGDRFSGAGLWAQAIESYRHAWKQSAHMTIKTFTRLPGGAMQLEMVGPEGAVYAIEVSTNLVDWTRLGPVTVGEEGRAVLVDPAAAVCPQRYYRLVEP